MSNIEQFVYCCALARNQRYRTLCGAVVDRDALTLLERTAAVLWLRNRGKLNSRMAFVGVLIRDARNSTMFQGAPLLLAVLAGALNPDAAATTGTQTSAISPQGDSAAGVWLHANKRIQIEIAPCGERLCAKIVWLKKPNNAEGQPLADVKNPDAGLRGRRVLGLQVLSGMRHSGPDTWADGTIYNPDDGSEYRATMFLKGDGALRIHAYVLVSLLGKTLVWTRVR